ncbi:hypothetical protein ACFWIQ_27585 [Kitasatospora sp. NPDC127059]|uniref:hypothetical protein n=1 Tax=unclassified Kitasatospora TaxID=2633591 RepID=UPI003655A09A
MYQDAMPMPTPTNVAWDQLHEHYDSAGRIPQLLTEFADGSDPERADLAAVSQRESIRHGRGSDLPAVPRCCRSWQTGPSTRPSPCVGKRSISSATSRRARGSECPSSSIGPWPGAWAQAAPRLLALLRYADPAIRRLVGFPHAQSADHADLVLQALAERWQDEPDAAAQP